MPGKSLRGSAGSVRRFTQQSTTNIAVYNKVHRDFTLEKAGAAYQTLTIEFMTLVKKSPFNEIDF